MTSHSGRTFLTSCLKVPIDPCNNCPAPIYNRPKVYLGRPLTRINQKQRADENRETEDCILTADYTPASDVKSLAKLYDSIPDYCDINHLPEEEFYSTLDSLRSTCRELKVIQNTTVRTIELSSVSSNNSFPSTSISNKGKKPKKKKSLGKNKTSQKNPDLKKEAKCFSTSSCNLNTKKSTKTRLESLKDQCEYEIKEFQKTLKEVEEELERPISSSLCSSQKSVIVKKSDSKTKPSTFKEKENLEFFQKPNSMPKSLNKASVPLKDIYTSTTKDSLHKSFSFGDIYSMNDIKPLRERQLSTILKKDDLQIKPRPKMSNYFLPKCEEPVKENPVEKILMEVPIPTGTLLCRNRRKKSEFKRRKKSEFIKSENPTPVSVMDMSKYDIKSETNTASAVYPVARPNLAATLRKEVARKKLQNLQNTCTYHDRTPQVDWEVRKTPAWKSLTFNDTHKEILEIRLQTRKAEQALQKKEYELSMELMRQRVKSAPLLMEGTTYWGSNVGKLTHTCRMEGITHGCETNQRKQKRTNERNNNNNNHSRRYAPKCDCGLRRKMEMLHNIYGRQEKNISRSTTHLELRANKKDNIQTRLASETPVLDNDSCEELSTFDRAQL